MSEAPPRTLLWGVCAGVVLLLGFAVFLAVGARLAGGEAAAALQTRRSLVVYGAVVLLKGLLPQLLLTFVLYRVAAPRLGLERTRGRIAAGVVACAAVAALAVAGLLMPLALPGWTAAVVYRDAGNFLATVVELTAAVALAALLPRWLLPALR